MKPATNAPMYVMLYPFMAELSRQHGYALAVHGTCANDFDLVAIPWRHDVSQPQVLLDAFVAQTIVEAAVSPEWREHDRLVYTLTIQGQCYIDISFVNVKGILDEDVEIKSD